MNDGSQHFSPDVTFAKSAPANQFFMRVKKNNPPEFPYRLQASLNPKMRFFFECSLFKQVLPLMKINLQTSLTYHLGIMLQVFHKAKALNARRLPPPIALLCFCVHTWSWVGGGVSSETAIITVAVRPHSSMAKWR